MKSAYQNNAVDTAPDLTQLTSDGYPTNGNSSLGIPATQPGAAWFHSVTSEIVNAITTLGGTPSSEEVNQLASALSTKFSTCVKSVNSDTPDSNGNVSITSVQNAVSADNGVDSSGYGWIRFKCGVQIEWGTAVMNDEYHNFSKTFVDTPRVVLGIESPNGGQIRIANCLYRGPVSFRPLIYDPINGNFLYGTTEALDYLAVGRWK